MRRVMTCIFERGDDGFWIASCLEVPGALTQGRTLAEARSMLRDAIREILLAEVQERTGRGERG